MIYFKSIFKRMFFVIFILVFSGGCTSFVEKEYDLSNPFEDIITAYPKILKATLDKAEFQLEGYFSGSGYLFLLHAAPDDIDPDELSKFACKYIIEGDIQYKFIQTWYLDFVGIIFLPIEAGTGKLRVRFRLKSSISSWL